jgi:hypothetical protein
MFEWDEAKRRANIERHGIDFVDVLAVFADPARVEVEDARRDYGERRYVILCPIRGRLFHVTWTTRGAVRRLISARRANRREQRIYDRFREPHAGGADH